jgi:hypothetical protein
MRWVLLGEFPQLTFNGVELLFYDFALFPLPTWL